jgi:F0F1-type ATP synthase assembly protein I
MQQPDKNKKEDDVNSYMKYMSAGFQIVAPVIAGVLIGMWLDKHFHKENSMYTIILSSVMIVVALYQFIKK